MVEIPETAGCRWTLIIRVAIHHEGDGKHWSVWRKGQVWNQDSDWYWIAPRWCQGYRWNSRGSRKHNQDHQKSRKVQRQRLEPVQRSDAIWRARNRENTLSKSHRRWGWLQLYILLRVRFRRDVRWSRCQASAVTIQRSQEAFAMYNFHRWDWQSAIWPAKERQWGA